MTKPAPARITTLLSQFVNECLLIAAVFFSRLAAFFSQASKLYTARYARLHEFIRIISKASALEKTPVILLGLGQFNQVFCVRPTKAQKELANVIILGKRELERDSTLSPIC